jgi:L-ascorbate metabolism protein UlaG (beta-lactamase superfamily)
MLTRFTILFSTALLLAASCACAAPQSDRFPTAAGDLRITFLKHASLMFDFHNTIIQVDPVAKMADYSALPKADIILVTHDHADHFEPDTIKRVSKEGTKVILTATCAKKMAGGIVLANGEETTVAGINILAVPAYNLVHKRDNGEPYHPKGRDNGYLLTLGDKRLYVAGDTENIPEMKGLTAIDIAFLPMNLPYTMTPEMVADAVLCFRPKVLYPYHFSGSDPAELTTIMKEFPATEVRVREMP